eukprot:TRINITY_DN65358_c0_g1_i1.p3 TRINITY_DN65358_c0_g1~~TRINITY_DN65358_c0_g1_i1.p3  ORF type:complete len:245 (-),score=19.35 TRINITY_DN65358_c0_g1_i1:243-944(-)
MQSSSSPAKIRKSFSWTTHQFYSNLPSTKFSRNGQFRKEPTKHVEGNVLPQTDIPRIIDISNIPRIIDPSNIPRIVTQTIPENMIPYTLFVTSSLLFLIFADIIYYVLKWVAQTDMSEIDRVLDMNPGPVQQRTNIVKQSNQNTNPNSNSNSNTNPNTNKKTNLEVKPSQSQVSNPIGIDNGVENLSNQKLERILVENRVFEERNRGLWWLIGATSVALYLLPLLDKEDALTP